MMAESSRSGKITGWLLLLLLTALALAVVAIPVWLIMPFRAQTATGVELSYALKRWSPVITLTALAGSLIICFWLWRRARWLGRIMLIVTLLPLIAATWFARQNHFEWMFQPLPNAAYARVSETNFVDDRDMVMSIELNGDAVAYPIRQMAYHHVVNDVVGGRPITATY